VDFDDSAQARANRWRGPAHIDHGMFEIRIFG